MHPTAAGQLAIALTDQSVLRPPGTPGIRPAPTSTGA
jgi:hypothetical protein